MGPPSRWRYRSAQVGGVDVGLQASEAGPGWRAVQVAEVFPHADVIEGTSFRKASVIAGS
jgi:hypothetical protein